MNCSLSRTFSKVSGKVYNRAEDFERLFNSNLTGGWQLDQFRNLSAIGKISCLVIQVLRGIGQEQSSEKEIQAAEVKSQFTVDKLLKDGAVFFC